MKKTFFVFLAVLLLCVVSCNSDLEVYKVTFNDGVETKPVSLEVAENATLAEDLIPENPSRPDDENAHYIFLGWSDGDNLIEDVSTVKFTKDTNLTSEWLTLKFNAKQHTLTGIECTNLDWIKVVEIPSRIKDVEVNYIDERAFYNSGIREVILPSTIIIIEKEAFANCAKLSKVYFTESESSLRSIQAGAFRDTSLQQFGSAKEVVSIPAGVLHIEEEAFRNCKIKQFKVLEANKNFLVDTTALYSIEGTDKFYLICVPQVPMDSDSLISLTLKPETVQICKGAFAECASVSKVILSDKITTIEEDTFVHLKNLEMVDLNKVTTLEERSFLSCEKLKGFIDEYKSLTTIKSKAIAKCNAITELDLTYVKTIESEAFYWSGNENTWVYLSWQENERPAEWSAEWDYSSYIFDNGYYQRPDPED